MRMEELVVERSVLGSSVAWVEMLARSDINVLSRAKLEM